MLAAGRNRSDQLNVVCPMSCGTRARSRHQRYAAGGYPFYLSVHYTAPHSPWTGHPQDIVDSYDDCPFETCPQEPHHPEAVLRMNPQDARDCLIGYFSAVTAMDEGVGRIVSCLDELGIRHDTLVCFVSDNGFNCGHHGIWGKGNGTLSLNMYDTSVQVPAIFNMPGTIRGGQVIMDLVSGYDFLPTLLDFVGLEVPRETNLPGKSRTRLLRTEHMGPDAHAEVRPPSGSADRHDEADPPSGSAGGREDAEEVVVFDEYGPVRMIRTQEWKYVHRYPFGTNELYDLGNDPGERENRYDDPGFESVRRSLKQRMDEWFLRYVDPAIDGTHEPVSGNGQLTRVGPASGGRVAFAQGRVVGTNPRHDPGMKKGE